MEEKKRASRDLSLEEIRLLEHLRHQPLVMERMQRILEIANSMEGPLKTADEIEEWIIEEMRAGKRHHDGVGHASRPARG
jgi:hypothetical protein